MLIGSNHLNSFGLERITDRLLSDGENFLRFWVSSHYILGNAASRCVHMVELDSVIAHLAHFLSSVGGQFSRVVRHKEAALAHAL